MMKLDHVGLVVADLDEAIDWYTRWFGCRVVWREAPTVVDDIAIGLPGEEVRLKGAVLAAGGAFLELHEFLHPTGLASRRPCDTGFGHIAFFAEDILADYRRLTAAGMRFYAPPRLIDSGGLAGHWWAYGEDPWGNIVQLCHHPAPADDLANAAKVSER